MAWSEAGQNARADAIAALIAAVSIHDDDPGASGTDNEWSGGGYTRQAPSYGAASEGVADLATPLVFAGTPLTTAAYAGLWDSNGAFLGAVPRTSGDPEANADGELTVVSLAITADGQITGS